MAIIDYIRNQKLLNQKIEGNRYYDWQEYRKDYLEHIENQYFNLIHYCNKYGFRFQESLDILTVMLKILKEEPEIIYLFFHAYSNPTRWKEKWIGE